MSTARSTRSNHPLLNVDKNRSLFSQFVTIETTAKSSNKTQLSKKRKFNDDDGPSSSSEIMKKPTAISIHPSPYNSIPSSPISVDSYSMECYSSKATGTISPETTERSTSKIFEINQLQNQIKELKKEVDTKNKLLAALTPIPWKISISYDLDPQVDKIGIVKGVSFESIIGTIYYITRKYLTLSCDDKIARHHKLEILTSISDWFMTNDSEIFYESNHKKDEEYFNNMESISLHWERLITNHYNEDLKEEEYREAKKSKKSWESYLLNQKNHKKL